MKTLLKILAALLLLPLFVLLGLYIHGGIFSERIKQQELEFDRAQEVASTSGNGFGGEPGLLVIDSGYSSEKFFWIDDDHLVFVRNGVARQPAGSHKNLVWNVDGNEIQPLQVDGEVRCWRDGYLYFTKFHDDGLSPGGRDRWDRYRATVRAIDDSWVTEGSTAITNIWPVPSDRHELQLTDRCEPWFMISHEKRIAGDLPRHRFEYLYEWGWLLRLPVIGRLDSRELERITGIYDLQGELYFEQLATKLMDLEQIPVDDLTRVKIIYSTHLDKYLVAATVNNSSDKPYAALLSREGALKEIGWDSKWRRYIGVPLVSKFGLVWSGPDYRSGVPGFGDVGSFIRDHHGEVLKYAHGGAYFHTLSPDGCKVAQNTRPKANRGASKLTIFDICNSRMRI